MVIGILMGSQSIGNATNLYPPSASDLEITNRGVVSRSRPRFEVSIPPNTFAEDPQFQGPFKIGIENEVPIAQYSAIITRHTTCNISGEFNPRTAIEDAVKYGEVDITREDAFINISTSLREMLFDYVDNSSTVNTVVKELAEPERMVFWLEAKDAWAVYTIKAPDNTIKYKEQSIITNFISNEITYFTSI